MAIDKIPKVGKIYKTVTSAYNALLKGFKKQTKRDPNPIEEEMIMEEAKRKITSQGENISTLDTGIMSQASRDIDIDETLETPGAFVRGQIPGTKENTLKLLESAYPEASSKLTGKETTEQLNNLLKDLEDSGVVPFGNQPKKSFISDEQMSAFTMDENARKLNKAKGIIDNLGAKTTKQKLFVAELVEDAGQGIFDTVDMGAVVRSNMFDDLVDQLQDDDLVMKIMYSGTKSDDFGITMAKIKGNAMDEGVDISDTIDFYERTFNEVVRPKKADGGRMGFADGPDDPKKLINKIPKVGKTVSGIESLKSAVGKIMNRFGEDAITTADKVDQPQKTTQQLISEFEARNKPRKILDVPEVPKGFKLSREKLRQNFPELDEDMIDQMMEMEPELQGTIIKMLENRRLDPDAYDKLLMEKGDTLEFQGEFDKVTRRKNNASGGLPHILGV